MVRRSIAKLKRGCPMHEVGLMQEIIAIAGQAASEERLTKVTAVKLLIGERICVMPEALEFSFQCLRPGSMLEQAELIWERCPGSDFYIEYIEGE
jgi:hydrogenase nickel incorporation protein HypA/HybF